LIAGLGEVLLQGDAGAGGNELAAFTVTSAALADLEKVYAVGAIAVTGTDIDLNDSTYTSGDDITFTTDVNGAHLTGDHSGLEGYYVAYKKQWDGPYTTASSTIPLEFFYYAAHATYADFLRMDGQVDKAMAEEQVAETYLALEMQKAAHASNNNRIYSRITTHLSTQGRW
jgi:hypothetical protein